MRYTEGSAPPSLCATEPHGLKCHRDSTHRRMKVGAQVNAGIQEEGQVNRAGSGRTCRGATRQDDHGASAVEAHAASLRRLRAAVRPRETQGAWPFCRNDAIEASERIVRQSGPGADRLQQQTRDFALTRVLG